MWRQWAKLLAALILMASTFAPARAQPADGDFAALFAQWQQAQDTDQRIDLGETLLARAPSLSPWPLQAEREQVVAELQFGVASGYINRPTGSRADNIEAAITLFEAVLPTWTFEREPQNWATLQNNTGIAYWARIRGERADNQERAIAHFEAALRVFTPSTAPQDWARLQNNLAVVYQRRVRGSPGDNFEAAIAHTEAALTIFTREAAPLLWAMAQNNLGSIYRNRVVGTRAENHEKAIVHLTNALGVFTREKVPREWASAHYNLANVYLARASGEAGDNQEKAIDHLDTALSLFTRDRFPMEWARAQDAIGHVYSQRVRGDTTINRELSIAAFEAALTVLTRDAFPYEHMRTARALGHVLLKAQAWQAAAAVHESARAAFLLLFGQGFDEQGSRALIDTAGPLFAEAALGALERGATDDAIALADEGRAHLLSVSMKLQTLELSAESRKRLDALRVAIRSAEGVMEAATGPERALAIEQLSALRRDLLTLVTAGGGGESRGKNAQLEARRIADEGGAVAIPIITALGGRLIVVTGGADTKPAVIDLPELTPERLGTLLAGADGKPDTGWISAYFANYFEGGERQKRWPQWLKAIEDIGPELWRFFGAELDATLKARGLKPGATLVWVPSGWLGLLPLGLAQDPESKRRLGDDYEIKVTPSLAALAAVRARAGLAETATITAVINPTGDLPGSEVEGGLVTAHFPETARTVLTREGATLEAVLPALKSRSHWHFASHGTFTWSSVRQSALIMHDFARLSVDRLIEAEGLGRPRLVVLSACETGLSEVTSNPDEFVGLPGAFLALGAAGVLGTLWPVNDVATSLLISRFYDLHIGEKLPPATALQRAQTWLKRATNEDLDAYVQGVAKGGRMTNRQASELADAVSPEGMKRGPNRDTVDWTAIETTRSAQPQTGPRPSALARPFAHPYFWGGFVHTGH